MKISPVPTATHSVSETQCEGNTPFEVWDQSGKAVQVLQATCGRTGSLLRLLLHFGLSPQGYTGETNKNCFKNELGSTYSKYVQVVHTITKSSCPLDSSLI